MLNDKPCIPWQVLKKAYTSQCDIWSLGATQLRAHWDALRWFRSRCCFQDLQISIDFWEIHVCIYIYTYYGIYTVLCRAAHAGSYLFSSLRIPGDCLRAALWLHALLWLWGRENLRSRYHRSSAMVTRRDDPWFATSCNVLRFCLRISIGFPYFPKVQTRNISTGSALLKLLKRTHWRGERLTVQL